MLAFDRQRPKDNSIFLDMKVLFFRHNRDTNVIFLILLAGLDMDYSRHIIFSKFRTVSLICAALFSILGTEAPAATFSFNELSPDIPPQGAAIGPSFSESLTLNQKLALTAAMTALQEGRFEAAEVQAKIVTGKNPTAAEGWHILGMILANLDRNEEALDALGRAADLYKANAEPLVIKGDLLLSLGRADEARQAYEAATLIDSSNWRATEAFARILEREGAVPDAIANYELSSASAPFDRLFPRLRLATLYLLTERPDEAVQVLETFIELNPDSADAITAIGQIQFTSGNFQDATISFTRAIELRPDNPTLRIFLANAQRGANKITAAESTLVTANLDFSTSADVSFELGSLLGAQGKYQEAISIYTSGLESNADNRRLARGAMLAHYRLDEFEAAVRFARLLANRDDSKAIDFFWLGLIEEKLGHVANAISSYTRAVDSDADNWLAANNLAALLNDSQTERAIELAERAVAASDNNGDVSDTLAWAYFTDGQTERALGLYAGLVKSNPTDPAIAYRYGRVLINLGKVEIGRKELIRALSLNPEFKYSIEARNVLENL